MSPIMARRAAALIGFAALADATIFAGCDTSATSAGGEQVGSIAVGLETIAADGATYAFPAGTFLEIVRNSAPVFAGAYPLDGADIVLTETVPAGAYTAMIEFPSGSPQLVRTLNGAAQTVPATWVDPQPVMFDVRSSRTTPLVLHFSVENLGDVTFQVGQVQVSIDVRSTTTTMANHGQQSGDIAVVSQVFPLATLDAKALALTVGESDSAALTFDLTTAFYPSNPGQACANLAPTALSALSGSAAFGALVEEILGKGNNGAICVIDQGANDEVRLLVIRDGAAPSDQQTFLPGGNYRFHWIVKFRVGDIYDGVTLKLSQLGAPIALGPATQAVWQHDIFDNDATQFLEIAKGTLSNGTIQLLP